MGIIESKFCPFRSTATQKIPCESDCMFYAESDTSDINGLTCAMVHNVFTVGAILNAVEKPTKK